MNALEKLFLTHWLKGEVKQMSKYKTLTNVLTAALVVVVGFLQSPAGQAVVAQYPHLDTAVWLLTTVAALYHVPLKSIAAANSKGEDE